jgi:hypothetical protein
MSVAIMTAMCVLALTNCKDSEVTVIDPIDNSVRKIRH